MTSHLTHNTLIACAITAPTKGIEPMTFGLGSRCRPTGSAGKSSKSPLFETRQDPAKPAETGGANAQQHHSWQISNSDNVAGPLVPGSKMSQSWAGAERANCDVAIRVGTGVQ